ncbi:helix-turn-helix transcriptional regulator [Paraglaciecola aquimarina]|uniref:Helix-turn-helix transcriptional regulator n=1 Tax=Paraglaciecola aquimarina TaxID=1235557 RepID=A0ABU3ST85_9ALTE|nr:helix-turn-helix transcriptional regulator [Paraglaciecola aquimarina]MDU0353193.1 helix-turn-helix transcriptional regulator [Paraglaciecola aquimarina]
MSNLAKTNRTGKAVKATPMPNLSERFSPGQLADAITAKRTGMKLSLVDVSEALSISKPTLVKIEKGNTNVKLANLLKVMEYLGLSFSLLCDDATSKQETGVSDDWY